MNNNRQTKSRGYNLGINTLKADILKILEQEVGWYTRLRNEPRQILHQLSKAIKKLPPEQPIPALIKIEFVKALEKLKALEENIHEKSTIINDATTKEKEKEILKLDSVLEVLKSIAEQYPGLKLEVHAPTYRFSRIDDIRKRIGSSTPNPQSSEIEHRLSFARRDPVNAAQIEVLTHLRDWEAKMQKLDEKNKSYTAFSESILSPLKETVESISKQSPTEFGADLHLPRPLSILTQKVKNYLKDSSTANNKFHKSAEGLLKTLAALNETYGWTNTVDLRLVEQQKKTVGLDTISAAVANSSSDKPFKDTTHLVNSTLTAAAEAIQSKEPSGLDFDFYADSDSDTEDSENKYEESRSLTISIVDADEVLIEPEKHVMASFQDTKKDASLSKQKNGNTFFNAADSENGIRPDHNRIPPAVDPVGGRSRKR